MSTRPAPLVSVVMPAYRAAETIGYAVRSVMDQTQTRWELLIVSDDGVDYPSVLAARGIVDPRIIGLTTGRNASGPSTARNVGLEAARGDFIALLDADDAWLPTKLERAVPLARAHGLVTTAVHEVTLTGAGDFMALRSNAAPGGSRPVPADALCWVNLLCNAVVVYDRLRLPLRFREEVPVMEDVVFCLGAYDHLDAVYFLAEPLHLYVVRPDSLVHSEGALRKFIETKEDLLAWVDTPASYSREAPRAALRDFLSFSLATEPLYADHVAGALAASQAPIEFAAFLQGRYAERGGTPFWRRVEPPGPVGTRGDLPGRPPP